MKRRNFIKSIWAGCAGLFGALFSSGCSKEPEKIPETPDLGEVDRSLAPPDLPGAGSLAERFEAVRGMTNDGEAELESMADLIRKDGYTIEDLDKDQLLALLDEKQKETGQDLSAKALHVLVGGRCAECLGGCYK